MTYTPVSCVQEAAVNLRACLKETPFVDYTVYPSYAPSFGRVEMSSGALTSKTINGYASYIDDGTDQSFFTDQTDPDLGNIGGYYTGERFMAYALNGGDYSVGYVVQDYGDGTDLTAASMTVTNVGNAGTAPPAVSSGNGPVDYELCGPSEAGGNRISWFESQTTSMHFLTSDGSSLTREQAFPIDSGESFEAFTRWSYGWVFDGTDFWLLSVIGTTAPRYINPPYKLVLTRFTPTATGGAYDYEKFEVTLADSALQALVAANGVFVRPVTASDTFFIQLADYSQFGNVRYLELSKDGTAYTIYTVTGNAAAEAFVTTNAYLPTRGADGAVRLIGWAYETDTPDVGTYDLTCAGAEGGGGSGGGSHGPQGHVYSNRVRRG